MKVLLVKHLIDFRNKSAKSKLTFVANLSNELTINKTESGGDYWTSCVSAISNSYKQNSKQIIEEKINQLEGKIKTSDKSRVKNMYQANINLLRYFIGIDLNKWKPSNKLTFLIKGKPSAVYNFRTLNIKVRPNQIFTFKINNVENIGAIWFIAKKGGYKKEELGVFTDILFKFLKTNFSKNYVINMEYCLSVDLVSNTSVNYYQIQKLEIPSILSSTINEIKKLSQNN